MGNQSINLHLLWQRRVLVHCYAAVERIAVHGDDRTPNNAIVCHSDIFQVECMPMTVE